MSTILLVIATYRVATLWEHYFHRDILHVNTQNFNLLWGGDWLRGSYTAPSKTQQKEQK